MTYAVEYTCNGRIDEAVFHDCQTMEEARQFCLSVFGECMVLRVTRVEG